MHTIAFYVASAGHYGRADDLKEPFPIDDLRRQPHQAWPEVLIPAQGCLPPSTSVGPRERVLHIALRTELEQQPGLARALRAIACQYAEVDWQRVHAEEGAAAIGPRILQAAEELRPTLVWLQIQQGGVIDPAWVKSLRGVCDPHVVIAHWDGDQHHEPSDAARRWFVELGRECDTSLVANTEHPLVYRGLGVRQPGYLQIGIDDAVYAPAKLRRTGTATRAPHIVFFASAYPANPAYARRRALVDRLGRQFQRNFAVYGFGWQQAAHVRPWLRQADEAAMYKSARAAISMSIRNDLARYTSDRLLRALASETCVLVEQFPDMSGLGLADGVNCRVWSDWGDLKAGVERLIADADPERSRIRDGARRLAHTYHTWSARMGELLAIVDAVRGFR